MKQASLTKISKKITFFNQKNTFVFQLRDLVRIDRETSAFLHSLQNEVEKEFDREIQFVRWHSHYASTWISSIPLQKIIIAGSRRKIPRDQSDRSSHGTQCQLQVTLHWIRNQSWMPSTQWIYWLNLNVFQWPPLRGWYPSLPLGYCLSSRQVSSFAALLQLVDEARDWAINTASFWLKSLSLQFLYSLTGHSRCR